MTELPTGRTFGPFNLDAVLGRGPSAVVYRATRTADRKPVALKIFHEDLDEATLRRIEDETRRQLGLVHPNLLKVESAGREGGRLYVASELFEGRSLRLVGSKSPREASDLLLKSARALGAAWMRLILHRDLKPENILHSASGDLKVCDFGHFRDATPYWAPERKAGPSADLRGDLYSLGTIFRELTVPGDADLDALLQKMTRVETFERIQMVEDVISRLESRAPAAPPPTGSAPPPSAVPAWQPPDPALTDARTKLVTTIAAVSRAATRIPALPPPPPKIEMPVFLEPPKFEAPVYQAPPPPPPPKPRPAPPSYVPPPPPPPKPARRRGGPAGVLKALMIMALAGAAIVYQSYQSQQRHAERQRVEAEERAKKADSAKRKTDPPARKTPDSNRDRLIVEKAALGQWEAAKAEILRQDAAGHSAEALADLDLYLDRNRGTAPDDAVQLRKSLNAWVSTVKQAEQSWKYGGDRRAADLLARAGPDRAKDAERLIAAWCEQDWGKVKLAVDKAVNGNDPYTASLEVERFLRKVHLGGSHRKEAEELQRQFQADLDWPDVADRVNTLKSRAPAEAASALEAFLAKPHQGGTHRDEVLKQIAQFKEDSRQLLYSGRSSVARIAVSPEARRVAYTADGVHVVDLETREELAVLPQRSLLRGLSFGSGDQIAIGTSAKIAVWGLKTEGRSFSPGTGYVVGLVMKDPKTVLAALSDGSFVTWDSSTDDPPRIEKDVAPGVISLSLSADRSRIAFAARDRSIRVRELNGDKEWKWAGPPVSMSAVALGPDGKLLATGSANGMVLLWRVDPGEAGPSVNGHTGTVTCADFSADGTLLATGGADANIQISSTKDGSLIKTLKGHRGRITGVAFVGGTLLSSGADGTVRIWPLK